MPTKLMFRDSPPNTEVIELTKEYLWADRKDRVVARAECFDPAKAHPLEIATACLCKEEIDEAIKVCAAACERSKDESTPTENVTYIVSNESGTAFKIGMARNPAKRLIGIQNGSWERLHMRGLFWSMTGGADSLEYWSLKRAEERGMRLSGEWVRGDLLDIATMIAGVAVERRLPTSSSEMFLRHRRMLRAAIRFQEEWWEPPMEHPMIFLEEIEKAA